MNFNNTEHYKKLFEHHKTESERYQAMLYHAWVVIRQQQKGLRRQAKKIKRLQIKHEITPCGIVQAISIAGFPMTNSTGVEWLRPIDEGATLYDSAGIDEAVRIERNRCINIVSMWGGSIEIESAIRQGYRP